jgi:hypothetical protein
MAPWSLKFPKIRSRRRSPALVPISPAPTTSLQPTSSSYETTSQSLQERLWNQAYDELKINESDIVDAYERILSRELNGSDSSSTSLTAQKNEIAENTGGRWFQMKQVVQAGLERTEKEAAVKQRIEEGMQAVYSMREIVDNAVQAAPQAALAWVGVCFALEVNIPPQGLVAIVH